MARKQKSEREKRLDAAFDELLKDHRPEEVLGEGNYVQIEEGLTDAMANDEAQRCLRCDVCIDGARLWSVDLPSQLAGTITVYPALGSEILMSEVYGVDDFAAGTRFGLFLIADGGTNIGAATIFVNYDGQSKHRTVIGRDARIGSDTMLVAPVNVGDGAYTAAGSVITDDVPAGAMAVGRARQRNIPGWVQRRRPGTESARAADQAHGQPSTNEESA